MATGTSCNFLKLKTSVQEKFLEIRKAIDIREKLLLRQIDVIASHQQQQLQLLNDLYFIPENEKDLLDLLRTFGKFNLDNLNFTNDLFINEDYILPSNDHETMHKCLNQMRRKSHDGGDDDGEKEEIVVNFSNNTKLIKENVDNINESIIHITLNEAKKLIEKAKTTNYHHQQTNITNILDTVAVDDGNDDDTNKVGILISQSSQTDGKQYNNKKHHINPNITINNCNGTINLKNISNLTINCVAQESFNLPGGGDDSRQSIESDNSGNSVTKNNVNSNYDDNGDNDQQRKQESYTSLSTSSITKDNENNSVNCEFYDRLISEIKNTIKQSQQAPIEQIPLGRKAFNARFRGNGSGNNNEDEGGDEKGDDGDGGGGGSSDSTISREDSYNRKLFLKNFENLKVILENNENETHPVQIEQWLTEIISETEIEPMQNTDILEYSGIHSN